MTDSQTNAAQPWYRDLAVYREARVWQIFGFGIISGFPWVLIGSMLSAWLQEEGLSRGSIGLFGVVFVAYSINALWSPLVDRFQLPLLHRWLGARRSWIVLCLSGLAFATFFMSTLDVQSNLYWIAVAAVAISFFSATQDVAIDAFRIESFAANESRLQSAGAAMATAGWWTGYSGLGAIPFYLVDGVTYSWQDAYWVLLGVLAVQLLFVIMFAESKRYHAIAPVRVQGFRWWAWVQQTFVAPVVEFFTRNGWQLATALLTFVFVFKLGEAFLGRMSIVFYKEIGFTNDQIATYSKVITWWVTIVFAVLGSIVNIRIGIVRGLLIGGAAMAASNLLFAWIALVGADTDLLLAAVLIDGFTSAWSTVAFVAFISLLCNRTFTASQYALLASLGNLGRTLLSSYSGFVVDWLDGNWSLFFILTSVMVIPGLLILLALRERLSELEANYHRHQEAD
ncbi:MFS transporter [Pseudidiomarina aestuarii]|uniref:MFS transporter n=1 Tax=Pseudidiomarina aestuarii TaxID=624146 RepID=A0A2T4D761_9GAMM|nr:MFS transporter [Pseudidiomarina aestuarii]PTB88825.1 MFS transporter [Pseudidiomarina aestuarii]PTB89653.1 MFS transporter [Pseudidiomarina aestuarii]